MKKGIAIMMIAAVLGVGAQVSFAAPTEAELTEKVIREKNFPTEPPRKADKYIKRALKSAKWVMIEPIASPLVTEKEKATSVTITGKAEVTQRQMIRFLKRRNPNPKLNCTITDIVKLYYEEAEREGIRPDIAMCQAFKETGFFNYGGDVIPAQNNYCGLGTTGGGVKGAFFDTPQLGVRAHIQHLMAYTTTKKPSLAIVDPRYEHIVKNRPDLFGSVHTWTGLNGQWAVPGTHYGQDILNLWRQAKAPDDSPETLIYATMDIRRDPKNSAAYLYRGIAYYSGGRYDEAIVDFDEALNLSKSCEGYYDRALCYEKKGDLEKAMEDYNAALRIEPNFVVAKYNRGLIYLKEGKYKQAIDDFDECLDFTPQMYDAMVGKGIAHAMMKKYLDAWHDFYNAGNINTEANTIKANQNIIAECYRATKK